MDQLGLLKVTIFGLSLPTVWSGTVKLFQKWDAHFPIDGKRELAEWLQRKHNTLGIDWPGIHSLLFARIFDSKPLSLRFAIRSCVASTVSFFAALVLFLYREGISFKALSNLWLFLWIVNIVPDYLALQVTSLTVRALGKGTTLPKAVALFVCDILITLLSATAVVLLVAGLKDSLLGLPEPWSMALRSVKHLYSDWPIPLRSCADGTPYGLFFYTSLFVSIWIWLYLAGALIVKALPAAETLRAIGVKLYDVKEHPIQSIGYVVAAILVLLWVLAIGVFQLLPPNHPQPDCEASASHPWMSGGLATERSTRLPFNQERRIPTHEIFG
jgi:hypothetical protein